MLRETAFRRCPVAPTTLLNCRISLSSAHEPHSRHAVHSARRCNGGRIYSGCGSGVGVHPSRQPIANQHAPACGHGVQTSVKHRSMARHLNRAPTSSSSSSSGSSSNNYAGLFSFLEQSQPRASALLLRCSRTAALSTRRSPSPSTALLAHPLPFPQALAKQSVGVGNAPLVFSVVAAIALSGSAVHAASSATTHDSSMASDENRQQQQSTSSPLVAEAPSAGSAASVSAAAVPAPAASAACSPSTADGSPRADLQFTYCQSGMGDRQPEKKKPEKSKDPNVLRSSKGDATDLAGVLDRLQTELPAIFKDKRRQHFSLYDNDVILENTMYPCDYNTQGLYLFRTQASLLHAKWSLTCRDLEFHLLSCEKQPEEGSIVIRWKIVGCPRWLPNKMASPERLRYLDGVTTFEVNGLSLVRRVKVSKVRRDGEHRFSRSMPVMGLMALGLAGLKKEFGETFFRAFRAFRR